MDGYDAQELGLGPNGGLLYCMDYLEKNMDWLQKALAPLEECKQGEPNPMSNTEHGEFFCMLAVAFFTHSCAHACQAHMF